MKAVLRWFFGVAPLLLFYRLQFILRTVILNHADQACASLQRQSDSHLAASPQRY
jgi:hypothetical protein